MITRKTMLGGAAVAACAAIVITAASTVKTRAADTAAAPNAQASQQVGLKAGDTVPAFHVTTIAGRLKGKSLCYV